MKFEGFIGQAYQMDSLPISAQRCINWYPEIQQDKNAATNEALRPTEGYSELLEIVDATLPDGVGTRAFYRTSRALGVGGASTGTIVVVVGPNIYEIDESDNSYNKIGVLSNLTSTVHMIDDGFGLIITDSKAMFRIDLDTKAFTQISVDIDQPTQLAFFGGYTLVIGSTNGVVGNTFFWSGLYKNEDGDWNAANYAQAEKSQDPLTGIAVLDDNVLLFGPNSVESWTTTGDSDAPFTRVYASSGVIGLHAPYSVEQAGNGVYFIGVTGQGGPSAYVTQGGESKKISTIALEKEWASIVVDDCTTWSYSNEGHDWVIFNFDALDKTYRYDINQGTWSECASRDQETDTLHRWEPNYCVASSGRILVGDRYTAKIYHLSSDYTTENGNNILRIRTTSHQNSEQKVCRWDAVRFDLETGNGITNEDPDRYTEAPQVMFRYSVDRARTWSSELRQEMGATGDYTKQVEFARLGMSRNLTVEFKISDQARTTILNGWIYPVIAQRSRRG